MRLAVLLAAARLRAGPRERPVNLQFRDMQDALLQDAPVIPHRAIVLDTETTGFTPALGDRLVELAAVELIDGIPTGREFHAYINPGRKVPPIAARIHGLTTAFLADKPRFEEIAAGWAAFVSGPKAVYFAHNAAFDQLFLNFELDRAGLPAPLLQCTMKLEHDLDPANRKLESLAAAAGIGFNGRGAHSALEDARVLARLLVEHMWPAEARLVAEGRRKPSSPRRAVRAGTSTMRPHIALPAGFVALTQGQDERIRRYDELDLDGKLTMYGQRWTSSEEHRLVDAFLTGGEVADLVVAHGRSPCALFLKLESLGVIAPGHPYTYTR